MAHWLKKLVTLLPLRTGVRWVMRPGDADGRRLAELLATVGEAIITIDAEHKIISFNREAQRVFGYSALEVLGRPLSVLLPIGSGSIHGQRVRQFAASGEARRHMGGRPEVRGRRRDGTEFTAEAAISKLEIDGDVFFTAVLRDVSELRRATLALRESERRFRDIAELAGDWLWETDETHRLVIVGGRLNGDTDLDEKHVIGKTRWELARANPEDDPAWQRHIAELKAHRQFHDFICSMFGSDGKRREFVAAGKPIFDEDGRFRGYRGAARDITAEFELKRELEKSHGEMLRILAALNVSDAAIVLSDVLDEIMYINDAAIHLFGLSLRPADLIGRRIRNFQTSSQNAEPFDATRMDIPETGGWHGTSVWVRPSDLKAIFCDTRIHRLPGGGFVTVAMDATARIRSAEEERRREEHQSQASKVEALGNLASGIAHDFNNLLGAIQGFAQFLTNDLDADSPQHRYAQQIVAIGQRGRSLVSQILAFTRRMPIEPAKVPLGEVITETLALLRATLPATTEMAVENHAEGAVIWADRGQLAQILLNLCVNGSDCLADSPGQVTISLAYLNRGRADLTNFGRRSASDDDANVEIWREVTGAHCMLIGDIPEGECVSLKVSDTGSGIPKADLERIFEPFFTTKEVGRGTGLGLAVVRRIVVELGGAILVRTLEGKGTVFEIFLRRLTDHTPPSPEPIGRPTRVQSSDRVASVLVVDDDEAHGTMVQIALERAGYKVGLNRDPAIAAGWLKNGQRLWDVLVTDQTMPRIKGSDLVRAGKTLHPDMVCIICTGNGNGLSDKEAVSVGADGLLLKPFDLDELTALIERLLDARPKKTSGPGQPLQTDGDGA